MVFRCESCGALLDPTQYFMVEERMPEPSLRHVLIKRRASAQIAPTLFVNLRVAALFRENRIRATARAAKTTVESGSATNVIFNT